MISTVSLFSGCGGFDAGFGSDGFSVVEAHDIDPVAVDTYNRNHKAVARVTDLRAVQSLPKADVVLAGPPCQGFSTIGSMRQDDERNGLLIAACEAATRLRPKLLLIENVMGLRASRNAHVLNSAVSYLESQGFFVQVISIEAESLGVAQRRRRLMIFARRNKRPFNVELPTSTKNTVRDAFTPLAERDKALLPSGSKGRLIAERVGPGQKLSNVRKSPATVHTWDIPEVFGQVSEDERTLLETLLRLRRVERVRSFGDGDPVSVERLVSALGPEAGLTIERLLAKNYVRDIGGKIDFTHTFNGTYRRLVWGEPSPTVDTHFGNARLFLHPEEHRGLTVTEAAALQGFPPNFIWPDSSAAAYRLIGNAVPPPISFTVAKIAKELV